MSRCDYFAFRQRFTKYEDDFRWIRWKTHSALVLLWNPYIERPKNAARNRHAKYEWSERMQRVSWAIHTIAGCEIEISIDKYYLRWKSLHLFQIEFSSSFLGKRTLWTCISFLLPQTRSFVSCILSSHTSLSVETHSILCSLSIFIVESTSTIAYKVKIVLVSCDFSLFWLVLIPTNKSHRMPSIFHFECIERTICNLIMHISDRC